MSELSDADVVAEPQLGSRRRLFLSYCRANGYLAQRLQADLASAGIRCWMDLSGLSDLDPNWRASIASEIEHADELLVLVSPESLASAEVQLELEIARRQHKPIRHLCLVPIDALPAEIRVKQLLDWSCRVRPYSSLLHDLIHDLGGSSLPSRSPLAWLHQPPPDVPVSDPLPDLHNWLAGAPPRCHGLDVSPYTRSWLLSPAEPPHSWTPQQDLAVFLRFSGPSHRNSLQDVLAHRHSLGLPSWLLYVQGPQARDGSSYHLPVSSGHIWHDCIEAVSRLLHYQPIKRLQLHIYLDAPAALAMQLGQRLERDRTLQFFQYVPADSSYQAIGIPT